MPPLQLGQRWELNVIPRDTATNYSHYRLLNLRVLPAAGIGWRRTGYTVYLRFSCQFQKIENKQFNGLVYQELIMSREAKRTSDLWSARPCFALILTALLYCGMTAGAFADEESDAPLTEDAIDGLVPVENSALGMAYVHPDADFGVFERVAILEPFVAFRSNWQRDQRRSRNRISANDMERIKADVARIFLEVFTETLEANDGYEVVDFAAHDVLLLRPAIIDLDVAAPDARSAGRSQTFSATAGSATLYLELFDSISGQKLARAADRRTVRNTGGRVTASNRVTNTAEARRLFRRWAEILRERLDEFYPSKGSAPLVDE